MDLLKCDVEGAELFVFRGGRETLARHQPIIFAEMLRKWSAKFEYHPNDIISFLRPLDYSCFALDSAGLSRCDEVTDATTQTNFIFLNTSKHRELIESCVAR